MVSISDEGFVGDPGNYTFSKSILNYDFLIMSTYTTSGIHISHHVIMPYVSNTSGNFVLQTENGGFNIHFPNDTTLTIDQRPTGMLIRKNIYGVKL